MDSRCGGLGLLVPFKGSRDCSRSLGFRGLGLTGASLSFKGVYSGCMGVFRL